MERTVRRVDERERYEITVGGELAGYVEIRSLDSSTALTHTVIEEAYEGQGVGSHLVRSALDDLRARGARVVPLCPFVASWIEHHEAYGDLVDTDALNRRRR